MAVVKNMKSRGNDGEGRFGRHNEGIYGRAERDIKFVVWEWKREIVAAVDAARYTKPYIRQKKFFLPKLYWNVPYTF